MMRRRKRSGGWSVVGRGGLVVMAVLMVVVGAGCQSAEPVRQRPPLPGQGEVSTLGWGRAQPGDAQRGMGGMMPQTR